MKPLMRRGADRAISYLPLLLLGLLALGTWWLVRNAPQPIVSAPAKAAEHKADYYMKDFSIKNFDAEGRLQSEMRGERGRHFPDTDTLEVDQFDIRSKAPNERITVASANRALSNSDGSEIKLFGNAIVTREEIKLGAQILPKMQFRGEFLHAWVNTERVVSDQPVTLTRGSDIFTADSMDYDNVEQVMKMNGRVHGTLVPTPATGR